MAIRIIGPDATSKCYNFSGGVHDGRICNDRSSDWIGWVIQVDYDHLRRFSNRFSNANKLVRLHSKCAKTDIAPINAKIC